MVAQDVIDRVHTEEMRGAIAVVGEDTSEQWLKYFDSKGFKSMSRVLNHESGKLKTAGEGEVLAATTWAKALGSDGADKNASPTKIQGLTLVERTSQLLEILASMRAACQRR